MTQKLTGGSLNPAIAFGINCTMAFSKEDFAFRYIYIYELCPLAGAALALIFYQYVYAKTQVNRDSLVEAQAQS